LHHQLSGCLGDFQPIKSELPGQAKPGADIAGPAEPGMAGDGDVWGDSGCPMGAGGTLGRPLAEDLARNGLHRLPFPSRVAVLLAMGLGEGRSGRARRR